MSDAITVAGRTFRPVTRSTFEHQLYMMPLVRAAGLATAGTEIKGASEADAEALLLKVIASRHTLDLLAGSLLEDGQEWSPEGADGTRAFFAAVTDPADIARLQGALVGLVASFFGLAVSLPATSDTVSPAVAMSSSAPSPNAATTISASGDTSSAPSPAMTPRRSRRSSGGRSAKPSSPMSTG